MSYRRTAFRHVGGLDEGLTEPGECMVIVVVVRVCWDLGSWFLFWLFSVGCVHRASKGTESGNTKRGFWVRNCPALPPHALRWDLAPAVLSQSVHRDLRWAPRALAHTIWCCPHLTPSSTLGA
jgi:hypothetical protein